jgi:hypothetical protein
VNQLRKARFDAMGIKGTYKDRVDVTQVVRNGASEPGEDVRASMGEKLSIELDVVFIKGDAKGGDVERDVQDTEEDEGELSLETQDEVSTFYLQHQGERGREVGSLAWPPRRHSNRSP